MIIKELTKQEVGGQEGGGENSAGIWELARPAWRAHLGPHGVSLCVQQEGGALGPGDQHLPL